MVTEFELIDDGTMELTRPIASEERARSREPLGERGPVAG